jgi:hypothetical protein
LPDEIDDQTSQEIGLETDPTILAQRRLPERTYGTRSFDLHRPGSRDHGKEAMIVRKVFDQDLDVEIEVQAGRWVLYRSPGGRVQVEILIVGEPGNIKELVIQRVPSPGHSGAIRTILSLSDADAIERLSDLFQHLDAIPMQREATVRIDDTLLRDLLSDQEALNALYREDRSAFRDLISTDASATDVIAVARRRAQVERFRRLLEEDEYFDEERDRLRGPERVWQTFFESNPWILGSSLAGQFLTSWSPDKLEQVVSGWNLTDEGRRADAVLRTSGRIRSIVLAEIKHHRTELLSAGRPYRNGVYAPSPELAGGVAQVQATAHQAAQQLRERIVSKAEDGSEIPGDYTYLFQPRSFLIIGHLSELTGEAGGDHTQKIRSFELFRRNMTSPEVLTFDEVLSRAEGLVGTSPS